MSLDDDLTRSGRAIAAVTAGGSTSPRRLRARRRRARVLAATAVVLVGLAGGAGLVAARDEDRATVVDIVDEPQGVGIEAGRGETRVTAADGESLGTLPAAAPAGAGDPVLDRVAGELLDDPEVVDRLASLGVGGDRGARAAVLADAGLVIETAIRPDALAAARRSGDEAPVADAAVVSVDPSTGEVVALAGPVATVRDQSGGLYLPFVMAAALAGGVGPDERIPAPAEVTATVAGGPWTVSNFDGTELGTVTLAE